MSPTDIEPLEIEDRLRRDLPRLAAQLTTAGAVAADSALAPIRPARPRWRASVAVAAVVVVVAAVAGIVIATRGRGPEPIRTARPGRVARLDRWTALPTSPLSAREGSTSVWTGSEWLVFGGHRNLLALDDSAAYRPATNTWRPLAVNPTMHPGAQAVWTGTVAVVLAKGGGWTYDPKADRWTDLVAQPGPTSQHVQGLTGVWTGHEIVAVGFTGNSTFALSARGLDPATDTWGPVAVAAGSPSPADAAVAGARWDGSRVQVWLTDGTGFSYDPVGGEWSPLAPLVVAGRNPETTTAIAGAGSRTYALATTDNDGGGTRQLAEYRDGRWQLIGPPRPAPAGDAGQQLVVAGRELVVFSPQEDPMSVDLVTGIGRPIGAPLVGPGSDRALAWTGTELLVWGGRDTDAGHGGEPGAPGPVTASGAGLT